MKARRIQTIVVFSVLCCVLAGCGNGNPLGRRPVTGNITLDGLPMDSGSISFRPVDKQGVGSGGPIVEGHYEVATTKGLPAGEYIVRISSPVSLGDNTTPDEGPSPESFSMINSVEQVPGKYNTESTLRATVVATGANNFDYDIETDIETTNETK